MQKDRQRLQLSPREQQLITFASEGLTDTAIALRLGISEATVGTYWGRVRIKIGPYNRTELVSIHLRMQQEEALDALRTENEQVISDLRKASEQQADQGSLYQELIENAPDAIVIVSESGFISTANKAAHELFCYGAGEMNGLPLIELIPVRVREIHQVHRAEYIADPQRRQMGEHLQTPALRKDGVEILVRAALSAIPTPTGLVVTCVLRKT
jgi:PAS domain S-box-containing protein